MDKREINRKPRWSFCKSRVSEIEVAKMRTSKEYKRGSFLSLFLEKGRQKERWKDEGRGEERMFSRVCTSERACAMRWNRVERKVKWSRPASCCVCLCWKIWECVKRSAIGSSGSLCVQARFWSSYPFQRLSFSPSFSFCLLSFSVFPAACNLDGCFSHRDTSRFCDKVKRNKCNSYVLFF